MKDEAAEYTTASFGSHHSPRLTLRTPETASSPSGPVFRESPGSSNWLIGLFAVIALLFVLATINQLAEPTETLEIPEPANPELWTVETSCTVTANGSLTGTTTVILSKDADVRSRVRDSGIALTWNGSTGEAFSEERAIAPTDRHPIQVTDTILPAGSLADTPELLRCGAQVSLP